MTLVTLRRLKVLLAVFGVVALLSLVGYLVGGSLTTLEPANTTGCNQVTARPLIYVDLPGNPFIPIPTGDGCWIFVSLATTASPPGPGVAVLKRLDGTITLERVAPLKGNPLGMILTHDGKLLIAAAGPTVAFLDVQKLISVVDDAVLGYWTDDVETLLRSYT